jgi:hypothetical protein
MRQYGGSFAQAMAEAWFKADDVNQARIKAAFPDLWIVYAELAERARDARV